MTSQNMNKIVMFFETKCVILCLFTLMCMTTFLELSQFSKILPSMPKGDIVGNMVKQMMYEFSFMVTYDLHFSHVIKDRKLSKC